MLHYRRHPVETAPRGGFLYVLAFEGGNYIQIGVGHESLNGLQLAHIKTCDFHHSWAVDATREAVKTGSTVMVTGKLKAHFDDLPGFQIPKDLEPWLIKAVEEVRDECWGHPLDWEPVFVDLGDGRTLWASYGAEIDKIRVGIGYINESNERIIGENAYTLGKDNAADFAAKWFTDPSPMVFFGLPPRWPEQMKTWVEGLDKRALAVAIVALGDKLWGDIGQPR